MKRALLCILTIAMASFAWAEGPDNLTATGKGSAENREEALRMAKAAALDLVFKSLKKDEVFQNLYISDPAIYGQTQFTGEKIEKDMLGKFNASIMVSIRPDVMNMVLNKYAETVSGILNQAESELTAMEGLVKDADKAMDASEFNTALKKFSEVRDRAISIEAAMEKFTDLTVRSDKLNNKEILVTTIRLRRDLAVNGLKRLEEIEKQAMAESALKDVATTFKQYSAQQAEISDYARQKMEESPFYDQPREDLEKQLIEAQGNLIKIQEIRKGLDRVQVLAQGGSVLFKERINQTLIDNQDIGLMLKKIEVDLQREIADPRMARVERDRASKAFWTDFGQGVSDGISFLFLRNSGEVFSFRGAIPPQLREGTPVWKSDLLQARLEGSYGGFWLRTLGRYATKTLTDGSELAALTQEAGIGFGHEGFFGFGAQWDWLKQLKSAGGGLTKLNGNLGLLFYLGSLDSDFHWPLWMLSVTYEVPPAFLPLVAGYQLNGGLDFVLRPGNIFKVEVGAQSHGLPRGELSSGISESLLDYEALFYAGLGIKFPNPILWGVRFENRYLAEMGKNGSAAATWKFYGEYSF